MASLCSCSTLIAFLAIYIGACFYYPAYPVSKYMYRPLPIVVFNKLGATVKEVFNTDLPGTKIDSKALVDSIQRSSGLSDLNATTMFWQGYNTLVESLNDEAELTTLGQVIMKSVLENSLKQRLEIIDYRKKNANVKQVGVQAPVFILGLPRTGTTFLHHLMSQDDERFRAFRAWELQFPSPPLEQGQKDNRVYWTDVNFWFFKQMCPRMSAVHAMEAEGFEECVVVYAQCFASAQYLTVAHVPSYFRWVAEQDMQECVEYHKMVLQHFSSAGGRANTWLLKTPQHIQAIDAILKVYPDAKFVYTHRDPAEMMSSLASTVTYLYGTVTDTLKMKEIGRNTMEFWSIVKKKAMKDRTLIKPENLYDVYFDDLSRDPVGVVENIYKHFGYDMKDTTVRKLKKYSEDNAKGKKHGRHIHAFSDFFDEGDEDKFFSEYRQRFFLNKK